MSTTERALGQFPLSIATSLAVESAFNISELQQHDTVPIREYEQLWVNVKTLFRNLHGAMDKTQAATLMSGDAAESLLDEMAQLKQLVADYSNNRCEVVFYISNYKGMDRKYPKAVLRMDTTAIQKAFTNQYTDTVKMINQINPDHGIKLFDLKLKAEHPRKALILTHIAYDLLSYPVFKELVLLESHTGMLKGRALWYTKYLSGKEIPMIPFREDFIQVFGDKETFRPMDIKLRRDLIEIATKYNWSPVTTDLKVKYGIEQLANPYARDLLKSLV